MFFFYRVSFLFFDLVFCQCASNQAMSGLFFGLVPFPFVLLPVVFVLSCFLLVCLKVGETSTKGKGENGCP